MVSDGQHRLNRLLQLSGTIFVEFGADEPFFNINTPEEYREALSGR